MVDLTPHPLVSGVAAGLVDLKLPLDELGATLIQNRRALVTLKPDSVVRGVLADVSQKEADSIAGFAASPDVPELVTFAGFVGATLKQQEKFWCVLYLDTRLQTWLLVQKDGIVFRDPVKKDDAPCGIQDVLWVKADTPVGRGSGSLSVEGQFLSGDFTRAADFDAAPSGGTLGAATGVFCEARSPGCCQGCTYRTRK
jgi:hypothetical protein